MADDDGIIERYRIREVTGIGTTNVFPRRRVVNKKRSHTQEEGEALENIKEEESPKSGKGIDIEV